VTIADYPCFSHFRPTLRLESMGKRKNENFGGADAKKVAVEEGDVIPWSSLPKEAKRAIKRQQERTKKIKMTKEASMEAKRKLLYAATLRMMVANTETFQCETPYMVAKSTHIHLRTLQRLVQCNNKEVLEEQGYAGFRTPLMGRPAVADEKFIAKLKTSSELQDALGTSARVAYPPRKDAKILVPGNDPATDPTTVTGKITMMLKDHWRETRPNATLRSLSETSLRNIQKQAAIVTVKQAKPQCPRRAEALADPYNFVSLAAMLIVLYSIITRITVAELRDMTSDMLREDSRVLATIDPRLIYNLDKSSTFLYDDGTTKIAVSKSSIAALAEKSRDPTSTATKPQRRSVSYSYTHESQ
jgi:hypothetical protein